MNFLFKNIARVFLVLTLLSACNDFENVFPESADERVKKAMEEYRATLLSAPNGWKAMILPGTGGAYSFYFDFHEDGTVTMVSDFNDSTAENNMLGTYVMKGLQRPTLSFDTYSYLHILADPSGQVNGGANGEGLVSDFEFAKLETHGDTLEVEGIQRDTEMILVKATSQEQIEFTSGVLLQSRTRATTFQDAFYYTTLDPGSGELMSIGYDMVNKIATLFYVDGSGQIRMFSSPFIFTVNGILFKNAFSFNGLSFRELLWDNVAGKFYVMNGGTKITLQGSPDTPLQFTSATPSLVNALGFQYTTIDIYPFINGISPEFLTLFNNASDSLEVDFGVTLDRITLNFTSSGEAIIEYVLDLGGQFATAWLVYDITFGPGGTMTFGSSVNSNGNVDIVQDAIDPLIDYFETNTFTLAYISDANQGLLLAGVYPQSSSVHFYGILE